MVAFNDACHVDENEFGFSMMVDSITRSKEYEAFEPLRQSLEQCQITNKPKLSYSMLYITPWQASYSDEVRHRELMLKIKKFVKGPGEDKPDPVLAALGRCVVAFNSDFIELRRRDIVEGLQMRYLNLMRNYLKAKCNDRMQANARFVEAMQVISYAREASEIQRRRLPV